MTHKSASGPGPELNLGDQFRLHVMDAAPRLRIELAIERRCLSLKCL